MINVGGIVSVGGAVSDGGGSGASSGITSINGAAGPSITLNGVSGISVVPSGNSILIGGEGIVSADGSGINQINGDFGPNIDLKSANGIIITNPEPGCIFIDPSPLSGIASSQSGVVGVNGIAVNQIGGEYVIDGAAISGLSDGSGLNAINGDIGPNIDIKGFNGIEVTNPSPGCIVVDGASISGLIGNSSSSGGGSGIPCYTASFIAETDITFSHNLGTSNVIVELYDNANNKIIADEVTISTANSVRVQFNVPQTGRVVIIACIGATFNRAFSQSFNSTTSVTINHNLGTRDVIVQVYGDPPYGSIIPDTLRRTTTNQVLLEFSSPTTGRAVIIGSGVDCSFSNDFTVDARRYSLLVS